MGAGHAYLFLDHLLLVTPGPPPLLIGGPTCLPLKPSFCPNSLLSQISTSCIPQHPWLHTQGVLLVHAAPWAPDIPPSLHLGPSGALPPELPVQGLLLSSQTPTGLCLRLQHPAWLVLFPPPRSSSCSLPVVLLAVGLLGVGGAPFPLASSLCITSASSPIPLGSSKRGRFINFFSRGNNFTSCQWISAFSSLGA